MLSPSTVRLVEGAATLGDAELLPIKGADKPVPARQLLGMAERADVTRAESNLVGRRWELSAIESLLARAVDGHDAVVTVVGSPGICKSRLVREVAAIAAYESLARKGETMTTATMATYAYDQIDQARTQLNEVSK
jgi:adenylate cyclase